MKTLSFILSIISIICMLAVLGIHGRSVYSKVRIAIVEYKIERRIKKQFPDIVAKMKPSASEVEEMIKNFKPDYNKLLSTLIDKKEKP